MTVPSAMTGARKAVEDQPHGPYLCGPEQPPKDAGHWMTS